MKEKCFIRFSSSLKEFEVNNNTLISLLIPSFLIYQICGLEMNIGYQLSCSTTKNSSYIRTSQN